MQDVLSLKFPAREVVPLIDHAMTYPPLVNSDRFRRDPAYWKHGVAADQDGLVSSDNVDPIKVPRYLILTRQGGMIFLVAGTIERLPDAEQPSLHRRVFAEGYAPINASGPALSSVVGERDFAEDLDLHWFGDALHPDCRFIRLAITKAQVRRLAPTFAVTERPRTTANRVR